MTFDLFNQPVIHTEERPAESKEYLEANRKRLSHNCRMLYDRMMAGEPLTSFNCGLVDFRRRVCDLRQLNGVRLSWRKIKLNGTTCKEWWMSEEDKQYNLKLHEKTQK